MVRHQIGLTLQGLAEHMQSNYGSQQQIRQHLVEILHDNKFLWHDPALESLRQRLQTHLSARSQELEDKRKDLNLQIALLKTELDGNGTSVGDTMATKEAIVLSGFDAGSEVPEEESLKHSLAFADSLVTPRRP